VERLMRENRIRSVIVRKTGSGKRAGPPVHDDLVRRDFTAIAPNILWLTDITEHPTA
jgi:transposase InsO family protein